MKRNEWVCASTHTHIFMDWEGYMLVYAWIKKKKNKDFKEEKKTSQKINFMMFRVVTNDTLLVIL
jgi:hypothetical protein